MKDSFKELSSELKAFKTMESLQVYLIKWAGLFFVVNILAIFILPTREDLNILMGSFKFQFEIILWTSLSVLSGIALYKNSFPQNNNRNIALSIGLVFSVLIFTDLSNAGHSQQTLATEFDLWRGRCGFLIMGISFIHAVFMLNWARQGASPHPGTSGLWASLSASALGCLIMQGVCFHSNTFHILIWHFLPMTVICLIGTWTAKKLLRW